MVTRAPFALELTSVPSVWAAFEYIRTFPYPLLLESSTVSRRGEPRVLAPEDEALSHPARYSFAMADPQVVFSAKGLTVNITDTATNSTITEQGRALDIIERWLQAKVESSMSGLDSQLPLPPFIGGIAGYIGYEYGGALENIVPAKRDNVGLPDVMLGYYGWTVAWDHMMGRCWVIGDDAEVCTRVKEKIISAAHTPSHIPLKDEYQTHSHIEFPSKSSLSRAEYLDAIEKTQEYIRAGDIFQANITQQFTTSYHDKGWNLYRQLCDINAAPFSSYFSFDNVEIISSSPERFILSDRAGLVETCPIKGTRPRGNTPEQDLEFSNNLQLSTKDRAEHVMIVDVLRNDISRVCEFGTVKVPELMRIEAHPTVFHMVSTIVGKLQAGKNAIDLFHACFPGGSITGAPKIRAMEIISELEPVVRNVYCGTIGYFSNCGFMDTSIAIRTIVLKDGTAYFSAGGGIVADSDPEDEYAESLQKAKAMMQALRTELPNWKTLPMTETANSHPIVSINGELLPKGSAYVSVFDRGFTRGDGIFETVKVENFKAWYLKEHIHRMRESSPVIGISVPDKLETWVNDALVHAQRVKADVGILRITLTRGTQETFDFSPSVIPKPTIVIVLYPTPAISSHIYDSGITVEVSEIRRDPQNPSSYIKSLGYMDSIIATRRAKENGFDDAVLLNVDGFVSEGATSNIFVVMDDIIRTPGRIHGILPGVTRSVVMKIAKELDIPVAERELALEEMLNSQEAFFTSSIRGIVPIVKIGDYKVGQGNPGTITKRLMDTYNKLDTR